MSISAERKQQPNRRVRYPTEGDTGSPEVQVAHPHRAYL